MSSSISDVISSAPYLSIRPAAGPRRCGRGDLGEDVALCRVRYADVPQDEAQHLVVELALADEMDRRDVERLAVRRGRLGVEAPGDGPAGVRPVRRVLDERDELAVAEHRHDRAHVLAVRAADEGVVHDEDVALVDPLLADPRDHRPSPCGAASRRGPVGPPSPRRPSARRRRRSRR